jgi:hypothetical protein
MSTPPETGSTRYYIGYDDYSGAFLLDLNTRYLHARAEDCPTSYATQAEADAALLSWCIERIRERNEVRLSVVTVTTAEE